MAAQIKIILLGGNSPQCWFYSHTPLSRSIFFFLNYCCSSLHLAFFSVRLHFLLRLLCGGESHFLVAPTTLYLNPKAAYMLKRVGDRCLKALIFFPEKLISGVWREDVIPEIPRSHLEPPLFIPYVNNNPGESPHVFRT